MKILQLLALLLCTSFSLAASTGNDSTSLRSEWGNFENNQTIKYKPADYTKAPIYKKISSDGKLKPDYSYLDKVSINHMVHLSDGLMVSGFLVMPKTPGNYPCIIYNRGGNGDYGQLLVATAVDPIARLASEGYIVVASNYRGNGGSEGKEEFGGSDVNDILNLANSLAEIPGADTSRIGLFGVSRGGMMAYLALSRSAKFKTIAVSAGIADCFLNANNPNHPDMKEVYDYYIDSSANRTDEMKKRSMTYQAYRFPSAVPVLILHGTKDKKVSYAEAVKADQVLDSLQRPHVFVTYKNDDHGLNKHRDDAYQRLSAWFDTYLKKQEAFHEEKTDILVD